MTSLQGKAVVITGAGRGLGRAYALACARAGANLVVNDVDRAATERTAQLVHEAGGDVAVSVGSVSDWNVAERTIALCAEEFGPIDGLVNNAGIIHHTSPAEETEQQLRSIVEVNVLGSQFFGTHAIAAMMQSGRGGSIVNIVSGAQFGILGMSAYGATKGAVTAMTHNWALEGEQHGIRVNAVSPLALTPMAQLDPTKSNSDFPGADEIAPLIVSLLSDATNDVTGKILRYDGANLSEYVWHLNSTTVMPQTSPLFVH